MANGVWRGKMSGVEREREKQRLRQQQLRERDRRLRRPSRDDFARMLLHVALDEHTRKKNFDELDRLQDGLVRNLVEQGFDRRQCELVFEDLIDKYKRGWSLRRKPHLQREDDDS